MRNQIVAGFVEQAGFVSGTIRIGCCRDDRAYWLAGMLTRLAETLPDMRLELSVDTSPVLARKLTDAEIDVAVMMSSLVPPLAVRKACLPVSAGLVRCPGLSRSTKRVSLVSTIFFGPPRSHAHHHLLAGYACPHAEAGAQTADDPLPAPLLHACASLSTTLAS